MNNKKAFFWHFGGEYRYGFNGQEQDSDIGTGIYTAQYWEYDSRLGRRWNVDPITFPWQSSYACFNNNPILYCDPLGLQGEPRHAKNSLQGVAVNIRQTIDRVFGNGQVHYKGKGGVNYLYRGQTGIKGNMFKLAFAPNKGRTNIPGNTSGLVTKMEHDPDGNGPHSFNSQPNDNPTGVRRNFGMQVLSLSGRFSNTDRAFTANPGKLEKIKSLYDDLSKVVNRDAYNAEALEFHIALGLSPNELMGLQGGTYTLRNGTVLTNPTWQQVLTNKAETIRAALVGVGIPNEKIFFDVNNMGGVAGSPYRMPATISGRFLGRQGNSLNGVSTIGILLR